MWMCCVQNGAAYPVRRAGGAVSAGDEVRLRERYGGSTLAQAGCHSQHQCGRYQLPCGLRLRWPSGVPTGHLHRSRLVRPRPLARSGHESAGPGRRIPRQHWQLYWQREYLHVSALSWRFASSPEPCLILDTQMISPFQDLSEGKVLGC